MSTDCIVRPFGRGPYFSGHTCCGNVGIASIPSPVSAKEISHMFVDCWSTGLVDQSCFYRCYPMPMHSDSKGMDTFNARLLSLVLGRQSDSCRLEHSYRFDGSFDACSTGMAPQIGKKATPAAHFCVHHWFIVC